MLRASIIGNLGGDPEIRYSASGNPYIRFNVASSFRTRTPEGERQERTEWVRITVFGSRADTLAQHLKRGSRVYVDGRLEAHPWTDREGQVRAGLEVMADTIEFMSPRQGGADFDTSDLPEPPASVADERPRRRMPEATAVYGGAPRKTRTAVADRGDRDDLQNLPF